MEGGFGRTDVLFERRLGDHIRHQVHGRFLENSGGFAGDRIFENFPPGRGFGVLGDAGDFQSHAVGQTHMQVVAPDEHGIKGGHAIDPALGGKLRGIESLLVPGAVENPSPRLDPAGFGLEPGHEFLPAFRVFQLDARQGESSVEKMGVAIDKTGKNKRPLEIERPGAL